VEEALGRLPVDTLCFVRDIVDTDAATRLQRIARGRASVPMINVSDNGVVYEYDVPNRRLLRVAKGGAGVDWSRRH
jgi:hypothetical protein